ncbi:hypothetical protein H2199_009157 [Coniosporium tulheliwenetii]|uniref:Uncharacterized protein n=1 Tax=Coniosporium tulheliwenetii TaxID=3383036 RepID=A0ACC2YFQ6_9PEZI|nr:hypothetical protein H2199_009157 [Cladosporium sp. JES 115]
MPSPLGYRQQTTASAARRNTPPAKARLRRSPSSQQSSSSSRLPASTAATSTSNNNKTKSGTSPKVTDKNFRSAILDRYGIHISEKIEMNSPFRHFSTKDPELAGFEGRIADWYQQTHPDCHVWLRLNRGEAANQAEQYRNMRSIRENEAKFSHRGKNYFFKEDDIFSPDDPGRCSSTYFKLEWGPTPDDKHLRRPPPVKPSASDEEDARPFAFNTNPDCTYWLTVRRLNSTYRQLVTTVTHVLPDANVTAPYLTIEFKKDHTSFDAAENQVAVSAALILFNRVRLRCRRLEVCGRKPETWTEDDFADVKHYGIAFSACEASFYIGRPSLSFGVLAAGAELQHPWRGCTLSRFTICNAVHEDEILEIKRWVNEIHNWGLGEHSRNFVLDVKGVLVHSPGGRDRISLLPEEIAALGLETGQPSEESAPI